MRGIERVAIFIIGAFFGYLGFRLFVLGITTGTATLSGEGKWGKLLFSGTAPGLFFMFVGGAVVVVGLLTGGAEVTDAKKEETTRRSNNVSSPTPVPTGTAITGTATTSPATSSQEWSPANTDSRGTTPSHSGPDQNQEKVKRDAPEKHSHRHTRKTAAELLAAASELAHQEWQRQKIETQNEPAPPAQSPPPADADTVLQPTTNTTTTTTTVVEVVKHRRMRKD